MRDLTEANLTDAVLAKLASAPHPRFKQIMTSLIRHLHAFVREVELTEEGWLTGIQFLTVTGQKGDEKRQEFILLTVNPLVRADVVYFGYPNGGAAFSTGSIA
jgi:hydroxyquinol 1,2-dioxygenase